MVDASYLYESYRFESCPDYNNINSCTRTANVGLSNIQFSAAGSRELENVDY